MGARAVGPLDGVHVLVIDNNQDARAILAATLEHRGAIVSTAASAQSALNVLRQVQADAVVCDINLGKRDAFWLIERARHHQRPPFIANSAQDYDEEELARAEFVAYLRKPIELETLTSTV